MNNMLLLLQLLAAMVFSGNILLTVTGIFLYSNFHEAKNHWPLLALISYIIAGIIYIVKVAPLAKKHFRLPPIPHQYFQVIYSSWND